MPSIPTDKQCRLQYLEIPENFVEPLQIPIGGMFATAPKEDDQPIELAPLSPDYISRQTWIFTNPDEDGTYSILYQPIPDAMLSGFNNDPAEEPAPVKLANPLSYKVKIRAQAEGDLPVVIIQPTNVVHIDGGIYVGVSKDNKLETQTYPSHLPTKLPGWIILGTE